MAKTTQFERELARLFRRRTVWLRSAIGKKRPGRAPAFSRKMVKPRLEKLGELAEKIVISRRARKEFRNCYGQKKSWHPKRGKGHGIEKKKLGFQQWFRQNISGKNCIYIFWTGRTCEYVGRTGRGGRRPTVHFPMFWFREVTRIDIYVIHRASEVPKAECLAIHLYEPRRNKSDASKPRYSKKCPVCSASRGIRKELHRIFQLRGTRKMRKKRKRMRK